MRIFLPLLLVGFLYADNEIYIDQSGNNANIDLEQLGSSNLIGGTDAVAGTMTALDLDGLNHRIAPVELELGGYFSIEVLLTLKLYVFQLS